MRTYGPLGLTLTKPEARTADQLDALGEDIEAIWTCSLNSGANVSGPAHWMIVDLLSAVRDARDEARKEIGP